MADASLFSTDCYFDEESSEWLPLAEFIARRAEPKPVKAIGRACYCGSGLPFSVCHGDGSQY
ncbi:MAG TPA: SEC-C metal-binding domain-containing protein [Chthoniobacteraceae bacterium]|nr:SEC-C metal-binding domain-containing protein [Chthoniobacteraceae bacterium]